MTRLRPIRRSPRPLAPSESAPRDEGSNDLLPPRPFRGVVAAGLGPPLTPAGKGLPPSDRDDALGYHRVPPVGEGDQGARPLAPAAQNGDHRDVADALGSRWIVAVFAHRSHREDLGRAPWRHPRRRRGP